MTTYGVLIKSRVAAKNVDIYNRSAVCSGSDLGNGSVFNLLTQSTSAAYGDEVWLATAPSIAGGSASGLWMAASPENVITFSGTLAYRGLNDNPQNFYNASGSVMDAIKPVVGDIVVMSASCISGSPSTGAYVVPAEGVFQLAWAATAPTSGSLVFKELAETYVSIGTGAINSQRILAYKLVCMAN